MRGSANYTALHLVCFFANNPDEELSTADIAAKTNSASHGMEARLRLFVQSGMLTRIQRKQGRMSLPYVYTAGPELLKMIGRA